MRARFVLVAFIGVTACGSVGKTGGGKGGAGGGGADAAAGGAGGGGGASGAGGGAGGGLGGAGGAGGASGQGGAGGGTVAHGGAELTTTGHVLKSTNFRMISTVGGNGITSGPSTSTNSKARSGFVPKIGE
jgi:hypothetical protein